MIHTDWGPDGSKSKVQAQAVLDVLQLELGMLKPDSPYLGHYDL